MYKIGSLCTHVDHHDFVYRVVETYKDPSYFLVEPVISLWGNLDGPRGRKKRFQACYMRPVVLTDLAAARLKIDLFINAEVDSIAKDDEDGVQGT
jgi:hypothetical protein